MSQQTPVYHITNISNLEPILVSGGLLSHNGLLSRPRAVKVNLANPNIQKHRSVKIVPCNPGGTLHDYVPFYFAPRSPMLLAVAARDGGFNSYKQEPIVHLASTIEMVQTSGRPFVIANGHGIENQTRFFNTISGLEYIDWNIVNSPVWDTETYHRDGHERKRRKQAELLIHRFFLWKFVTEVGVFTEDAKEAVEQIIASANIAHRLKISVRKDWYH